MIKSCKVVLLCGAFLYFSARGILWRCVIKSRKVVLLCRAFLFFLARGKMWRIECVNTDCSVLVANLLPYRGVENIVFNGG